MTRPISRVLSSTAIYLDLSSPTSSSRHNFNIRRADVNDMKFQIGVASGKVCIAVQSPVLWYALTAPFHHHPVKRQFISVALFRESPPAAVSSYPAL